MSAQKRKRRRLSPVACVDALLLGLEPVHSPAMTSRIRQARLPHEIRDRRMFAPGWVTRLALRSMITTTLDDVNAPARVVGRAMRRGLDAETCEAAERLGGWEAVVALAQGFAP